MADTPNRTGTPPSSPENDAEALLDHAYKQMTAEPSEEDRQYADAIRSRHSRHRA
jgi:hypothetical protein